MPLASRRCREEFFWIRVDHGGRLVGLASRSRRESEPGAVAGNLCQDPKACKIAGRA